jgi:hypothetical protein
MYLFVCLAESGLVRKYTQGQGETKEVLSRSIMKAASERTHDGRVWREDGASCSLLVGFDLDANRMSN